MSTQDNKQSDQASEKKDEEIGLLDALQVIAENLRPLLLGPILVGLLAFGVCFLISPTFTANTKILPPQQQQSAAASMLQSLGALGGLAGAAVSLKNPNDQYISFLSTRSVQDALIKRFKLQERYEQKHLDSTRKSLEKKSSFIAGKDNIINIQVDDKDPNVAAEIANAYVEELSHLLNRLAVTEAQQRRLFFEKQLSETKIKLTEAEKSLAASGVTVAALNANPTFALEGPARLRAQATAQEVKIAAMRSYLTDSAPEFRQALSELAAIRSQLAQAEREQAGTGKYNNGGDYINKYREYKYQENLFELFTRQFEIAKIDESREGAVIQIVDPAQPPERKSKPKRMLIAAASSIASFLILLIIFFSRKAISPSREKSAKIAIIKYNTLKSLGLISKNSKKLQNEQQ